MGLEEEQFSGAACALDSLCYLVCSGLLIMFASVGALFFLLYFIY